MELEARNHPNRCKKATTSTFVEGEECSPMQASVFTNPSYLFNSALLICHLVMRNDVADVLVLNSPGDVLVLNFYRFLSREGG